MDTNHTKRQKLVKIRGEKKQDVKRHRKEMRRGRKKLAWRYGKYVNALKKKEMTEDLASKEKEEYDLMMKEEGRRKNEWKNDG